MLLRLRETLADDGRHRLAVTVDDEGRRTEATADLHRALSPQDRERARWYFEDSVRFPADPGPALAVEAESWWRTLGRHLGQDLRDAIRSADTAPGGQDLWTRLCEQLPRTRVEVSSALPVSRGLPWESIRDPDSGVPLILRAGSFTRVPPGAEAGDTGVDRVPVPGGRLRVLLVICRPRGTEDVPFLPVAEQLVRTSDVFGSGVDVDVLRPATFDRLGEVLRAAARDRPYQVVHFDGHGTYAGRGYLLFEDPAAPDNRLLVSGDRLGTLLKAHGVSVLLVNACRSAHSEETTGSFAQEVADAGVPGVVAMQYSVHVTTAARFAAEVYPPLFAGRSLGAAVRQARTAMHDRPLRGFGSRARQLQDWCVPLLHEARPLAFAVPEPHPPHPPHEPASELPAEGTVIGQDDTVLALDRFYDTGSVALLTGMAGAGKSSTARAFGRWYLSTGGLRDPRYGDGIVVHWTAGRGGSLPGLLESFADAFAAEPGLAGPNWSRLDAAARRRLVLEVCARRPVLWIWDGVDTPGAPSVRPPGSPVSSAGLRDFLRDLSGTRAKVLLTSRRNETALLSGIPALRLPSPPLAPDDRLTLAETVAARTGLPVEGADALVPLLEYAKGNPRVITEVVALAGARRVRNSDGIRALAERLEAGSVHEDGRPLLTDAISLRAAVVHGRGHFRSDRDRALLAALHLFRHTVHSALLSVMSRQASSPLPGSEESACLRFLERAEQLGLLSAHQGGAYRIHPVLPGLLRADFAEVFGPEGGKRALRAVNAYTMAVASLAGLLADDVGRGRTDGLGTLVFLEDNVRHARSLARLHGRQNTADRCADALAKLYRHLGLRERWNDIVGELAETVTDLGTGGPHQGRLAAWLTSLEQRVRAARDHRRLDEAERLQHTVVEHSRALARRARDRDPWLRDPDTGREVSNLAAAVGTMGQIRRDRGHADCLDWFEESLELMRLAGDRDGQAVTLYNLGEVHRKVPALRNLDTAERYFHEAHELADAPLGRAKALGELGYVAWLRSLDARDTPDRGRGYASEAMWYYKAALAQLPAGSLHDEATTHHQIGLMHQALGAHEPAQEELQRAVDLFHRAGEPDGAGLGLQNLAVGFATQGRSAEARRYAQEALRTVEPYGDRLDVADKARRLLAMLDSPPEAEPRASGSDAAG